MMSRRFLALALTLAAAGCASTLEPAPQANQLPNRGEGAIAAQEGVQLIARAGAWEGTPRELSDQVTPMLVTIVNASAEPVRIGYQHFRLVSPEGRRYSALPPFQIDGSATVRVGTAHYAPLGFAYAPYMGPYFPGAPLYDRGFATNPRYWDRFVPVMRTVNLPTFDMLRKALPEGVLEPGGRLSGFLYFEGVGPGVERVELRADFENADTGERIVRLDIPFTVG